jgi:four helix bundle protein
MTTKSYHDLRVWKKSINLVTDIYKLTSSFPRTEQYGLTSQLWRAAVSIPSDIAEGQARQHTKEFKQFLHVTLGSIAEVDTQLIISQELGYLEEAAVNHLHAQVKVIRRKLYGLINNLPSQ